MVLILGVMVVRTSGGGEKKISRVNLSPVAGLLTTSLVITTLRGNTECLGFIFPVCDIQLVSISCACVSNS